MFDNKRDVIFLLFPISLLEIVHNKLEYKKNTLIYILIIIILTFILIIFMSIKRGYGNFGNNINLYDFVSMFNNSISYITSSNFVAYFFNNIEVNYVFFHTFNSIEYIINDFEKIQLGSTLIKPIFIFIPRDILNIKPQSIIDLYTLSFDSNFRKSGGSWPINIFCELFWNFHLFGIIFLYPLFYFLNLSFSKLIYLIKTGLIINNIWFLYMFKEIISLFRGSGFDIFIVNLIISFTFWLFYKQIFKINGN
jgi:hypothetical protein